MSPDTVLKNYWNGNEEFADLFNAVLFGGSQVIKPYELENEDTEASVLLEHRDHTQSIKAVRDNIKIQKKSTVYGVQFVLLGLESQEHIHYAMPLRVMGYDYVTDLMNCHGFAYMNCHQIDWFSVISQPHRAAA